MRILPSILAPAMDILKRVVALPQSCRVDGSTVYVGARAIPADTPVAFPRPKSREYTLGSVVFFLLHSNLSFTEYAKKCQEAGITSVNYLDQSAITEDISNYRIMRVDGEFIRPSYSSHKKYTIPDLMEEWIILLISDFTSKIRKKELIRLLFECDNNETSHNTHTSVSLEASDKKGPDMSSSLTKDGRNFTICDNVQQLTVNDWPKVCAVFVSGRVCADEAIERLKQLPKQAARFAFQTGCTRATSLQLINGRLDRPEKVWQEICEATASETL